MKCKSTESSYLFGHYTNLNELPTTHWNEVLKGNKGLFLQLDYLSALERVLPSNVSVFYTIAYHKKTQQPCFVTQFQVYTVDQKEFEILKLPTENPALTSSITHFVFRKWVSRQYRVLVLGNLILTGAYSYAHTSAIAPNEFNGFLDELFDSCRKKVDFQAIVLKDCLIKNTNATLEKQLVKNYSPFYSQPNMVLDIKKEWKTFEDYLGDLSAKYRTRYKSTVKKSSQLVRKDLTLDDLCCLQTTMYNLFNEVYASVTFKIGKIKPTYFVAFKEVYPTDFRVVGYFLDEELVAFASYFYSDHTLEANYIGMNYSYNQDFKLYQTILYDYVRWAIDLSAVRLCLSRTAMEIKSTLGAEAQELLCVIRLENCLANQLVHPVIVHNTKPTNWVQRRPFKHQNEEQELVKTVS